MVVPIKFLLLIACRIHCKNNNPKQFIIASIYSYIYFLNIYFNKIFIYKLVKAVKCLLDEIKYIIVNLSAL